MTWHTFCSINPMSICRQSGRVVRVHETDTRALCPRCSQQVSVAKVRRAKALWLNSGTVWVANFVPHDWRTLSI